MRRSTLGHGAGLQPRGLALVTLALGLVVSMVPAMTAHAGVDGDGNLDVVFANVDGADSQVCIGDGSGDFACSAIDIDFDPGARSVEVGHLDGDCDLDLVFVVAGGTNKVCMREESGPSSADRSISSKTTRRSWTSAT